MNKLYKYNDFIFDKLFEDTSKLELVFSSELNAVLNMIEHPIAKRLLESESREEEHDFTLIDIGNTLGMVSFCTSNKLIELLSKSIRDINKFNLSDYINYNDRDSSVLWDKFRSEIKIGKLVRKLYGDEFDDNGYPGYDIESFVNLYKAEVQKLTSYELFDIVKGQDIVYWYQIDNYGTGCFGSELGNSCMAEDSADYLKFYALNSKKVSMLILYEDENKEKIVGRALLWKIDEINEEPVKDRIFMDRVYSIHEYQQEIFKKYAKDNNWLYKYDQVYGSDEELVDPSTGEIDFMNIVVKDINLSRFYPYLDTLQYLFQDNKILTNNDEFEPDDGEEYVKLIDVDGNPIDAEYNEYYNKWITSYDRNYVDVIFLPETKKYDGKIRKEDGIYLHGYGEYIPKELYDDLVIKTDYGIDANVLKEDAIFLDYYGAWTTKSYANVNMVHSSFYKTYLSKEDAIFSKILGDYIIKEDSMKVYKDQTKTDFDFLPDEQSILNEYTYSVKGDYILKK